MSELDVPYFPEDFVWGVSSAAYQIESAVTEDGRGESFYWYRDFIASQRRSSQ